MNHYILAAILGVVEGLTEFLPVSSTAHLRLAEHVLGLELDNEYWKMFSIVIQLGAILSVLVIFRERLRQFIAKPFDLVFQKTTVAFVVTAGPAFLLTKLIGKNLESLTVIGFALLVGGIVMVVIDGYFVKRARTETLEQMTWMQAVGVGAAQIFSAVFPGTSRSMSTIAGGEILGMTRAAALEFSFLLSVPTMTAATLYDLYKSWRDSGGAILATGDQWLILGIGFVVSFFVAWAVIAWFLAWVRKHGFLPFGIYRVLLGLFVLIYMRG